MSKATAVLGAASVVVALSAAGYCAYRSVVSERRMAGLEARLAEAEKKVAENAKCIEMQASCSTRRGVERDGDRGVRHGLAKTSIIRD